MIWYENSDIIAEETEMRECVITNKTDQDIYLIFNKDAPLKENLINPHETMYVIDEDLIRRIKAKEMYTFSWQEDTLRKKVKA